MGCIGEMARAHGKDAVESCEHENAGKCLHPATRRENDY
jgi:hypothetical protein